MSPETHVIYELFPFKTIDIRFSIYGLKKIIDI